MIGSARPAACHREFQLARDVEADCTAPALGYGTSEAVSYLVTAYLPGYRCATTLTGTPTAQWLWVIDFGISRYVSEPSRDDQTVQCSPGWAEPEQLRAALPTPAVDVFAWGCVLAYLAGGVHPFAARGGQEWFQRVQSATPDLFGLPPMLDEVVRWSLARNPADRPSAAELSVISAGRR